MAEVTKYQLITNNNNNNIISDIKTYFSVFKLKKRTTFIYTVFTIFLLFTLFLAFSPSSTIFTATSTSTTDESIRSHFSSFYSFLFPNPTQTTSFHLPMVNNSLPISLNSNTTRVFTDNVPNFQQNNGTVTSEVVSGNHSDFHHGETGTEISQNTNKTRVFTGDVPIFQQNNASATSEVVSGNNTGFHQGETGTEISQNANKTRVFTGDVSNSQQNNANENAAVTSEVVSVNNTDGKTEILPQKSALQQSSNQSSTVRPQILSKNRVEEDEDKSGVGANLVEKLVGCDLYDGGWVKDKSYPLYKPGSCKLIDGQFNCALNGRLDNDYYKLKWKPNACSLPRLNAKHMLKLLKGKRLVFVGDSLNRNMWESLVCILKSAVMNKKKVYEAFGRHHFRTEASYSYVFKDYKCTVEFFVAPFLVQQWEVADRNGTTKETLRLDQMVSDASQYKSADYIVFNTGHWWTHYKTSKGADYYQEGSHVYKQLDVTEAFRRAITTWSRWVDANINPQKTHVLFRGYSASHFRGGQWNAGGKCDGETEPIKNDTYLTDYPWKSKVFESVIKDMKTPVSYLNVTRLTDYRKDAHPSVYRKHLSDAEKKSPLKYQDCSHWCLPGVPDLWNELLYAELLRKQNIDKQLKNKT